MIFELLIFLIYIFINLELQKIILKNKINNYIKISTLEKYKHL